jgi:hypothetical protein
MRTHVQAHTRSQMLNDMTNIADEARQKIEREQQDKIINLILRWEDGQLDEAEELGLMHRIQDTGNISQYGEAIKQRILTLKATGILTTKGITPNIRNIQNEKGEYHLVKSTKIRATSNRSIIERFLHQNRSAKARHLSIHTAGVTGQNHLYSYNTPISRFYTNQKGERYLLINSEKKTKTTEVHKNILRRSADSQKIPVININFTQPFSEALENQFRTNDTEIEKHSLLSQKARKALRREKFELELKKHNQQNTLLRMLQTDITPMPPTWTAKDILTV